MKAPERVLRARSHFWCNSVRDNQLEGRKQDLKPPVLDFIGLEDLIARVLLTVVLEI